jgi:hypothetical protein
MPVPTSTAEVAAIVSYYYAKTQTGQPATLRVSRPKFHSTATFVCPVAPAPIRPAAVAQERAPRARGGKAPLEIAILQSKLNKLRSRCWIAVHGCNLQLHFFTYQMAIGGCVEQ